MLCEKCGTENKEGTSYCKKCGENLFPEEAVEIAGEAAAPEASVIEDDTKEEKAEKATPVATAEKSDAEKIEKPVIREKSQDRVRTSPLAVRMQEKSLKEDKKIRAKLKRGKAWAAVAIILAVMLVAENAVVILDKLGYLGGAAEEPPVVEPITETTEIPEVTVLNSKALRGEWTYSYKLKKNWDSDNSGDYETVTEIITSSGNAALFDEGGNHMSAMIIPGEMVVDGETVLLGDTPEAFSAWYEEGFLCIQMRGTTEQKFFAPGGFEALVVKIPVSMDSAGVVTGGTYTHTYDKVVTEMSMRYEIEISLEKK